jgi:hypothetical protein
MVAVYSLFLSMVIGGGLDHCMVPPSFVGGCTGGTVASELQAGNISTIESKNAARNNLRNFLLLWYSCLCMPASLSHGIESVHDGLKLVN